MTGNETEQSKIPDPEAVPRAERRRYPAEEKLRILEEADACHFSSPVITNFRGLLQVEQVDIKVGPNVKTTNRAK